MIITNLILHEKLPFEDYRKLTGMSFSGTKTFTPIVPTFKMKLGTALDQYLTEPSYYDGFEYDLIRKAAPLVRAKMGKLWDKLQKQLSYTCTMKYQDFELPHKGRPDFTIPGKIVIDLKYVDDRAAIDHFDYPSQLSGYALSLDCPMAFILEMSRKRNEAKLIPVRIGTIFGRGKYFCGGIWLIIINFEFMTYNEFLDTKRHSNINYGIQPNFIPNSMFDFQKYVSEYAIKKGRCAVFLDTGLGKTIIELTVAKNYIHETNKPVLIITPLAVAFQFIKEAEKFGIDDIEYSKTGKFTKKIVVCNYERLEHFNYSDFDCVILDESSILKNFDGAIRQQVTNFLRKVKYRFLFTATPSPNDYIELGTSSEALGYLGYTDMLTKFFKNNNNNTIKIGRVATARDGCEWYLKAHAEKNFWQWIASWSISMRKPSDLGFSDELHILPELIEKETIVRNVNPLAIKGQTSMFTLPAQNFLEIKAEVRSTIHDRCEMAVNKASGHDISVYWVNLNDEADLISKIDKSTKEVKGKMNIDQKEEILLAFSNGEIKKLITKTSITAFGLNWQHCNHTIYFPTYSYEQYYQAIRRFWRFGQKRNVFVDLILSDGQTRIMQSLMVKKDKAITMFESLTKQTNSDFSIKNKSFDKQIKLPSFI